MFKRYFYPVNGPVWKAYKLLALKRISSAAFFDKDIFMKTTSGWVRRWKNLLFLLVSADGEKYTFVVVNLDTKATSCYSDLDDLAVVQVMGNVWVAKSIKE